LNDRPLDPKLSFKRKYPPETKSSPNKKPVLSISPETSPIEEVSELVGSDSAFPPRATSTQSVTAASKLSPLEVTSKVANHSGVRRRDKVVKINSKQLRGDTKNISDPLNANSVSLNFSSPSSSHSPRASSPVPAPAKGPSKLSTKFKIVTGNAAKVAGPDGSISDIQNASSSSIVAGPSKVKKPQTELKSGTKTKGKEKAKAKVKPQLVTPLEYAQKLQEKMMLVADKKLKPGAYKHLKNKKIFYIGGDMQYAGDRTRGRMDYVNLSYALSMFARFSLSPPLVRS
jgi:hypothetical protein